MRNFRLIMIVLLMSFFTNCSKSSSDGISDVARISKKMNDALILPPGSFTIDPSVAEIDETITIQSNGSSASMPLNPGQSMTNNISFTASNGNVNAVGMRFGSSGPIHFVPIATNGATAGTGAFEFQLPDGLCDDLSSICHDIKCYEFASTAAGNISRSNITNIAMMCGNCDEPSCKGLVDESQCDDSDPCDYDDELEDFNTKVNNFSIEANSTTCSEMKAAALIILDKLSNCGTADQSIKDAVNAWHDVDCSVF